MIPHSWKKIINIKKKEKSAHAYRNEHTHKEKVLNR